MHTVALRGPERLPLVRPEPPSFPLAPTEARTAVRRFVAVLTEVLNGYRPPAHLRHWCRPLVATTVIAQARAAQHRIGETRPRRVTRDRHGRRPDPVAVIRMRLCEPRSGAVEATVLLATGVRTWALALRLEEDEQGWATTVARLL